MTSAVLSTTSLLMTPQSTTTCCPNLTDDICPPYELTPDQTKRTLMDSEPANFTSSTDNGSHSTEEVLAGHNRLAEVNKFTLNPDEPKRSLAELVQELMSELGKKDLNRLWNIMMSYDYEGNEWKRYEFVDPKKKYTRNLIACVPNSFALMLLCWNPEKASPIHNHAGSECFLRVLSGRLVEKQYIVRNGEGDVAAECNWNKLTCSNMSSNDLIKSHEAVYETGACTFINDSLGVHSVENPFKECGVSLHCYIPGYDTCKSYCLSEAQAEAVKVQQCTISFDTEQGERTHH